jgi:hypothetical protein
MAWAVLKKVMPALEPITGMTGLLFGMALTMFREVAPPASPDLWQESTDSRSASDDSSFGSFMQLKQSSH